MGELGPFGGVQIRETLTAVEPYEDWLRVRSPGRAARRLKRGFRQNIVHRYKPAAFQIDGVIYAHPEIVRALRQAAPPPHSRNITAGGTDG